MRQLLALLLVLLMTTGTALACDETHPVDPAVLAELLPAYTYIEGIDDGDVLRLLMRNAENELVFVGGVKEDSSWAFTYSSPLPEGTILGVENFTHSLGIPNGTYYDAVSLQPYADGTWGVSLVYPNGSGLILMGKHVVFEEVREIDGQFGDHPWSDVTCIDWTTLPTSYSEAVSRVDTTRWAVVNNPNPADRLNLRCEPSRNSPSLGRYYNRTPVRIDEYGEQWCAVRIGRFEGYMMTKFLAFSDTMDVVAYAGPDLGSGDNRYPTHPVPDTDASGLYRDATDYFVILGMKGDFYHVWYPDEEDYAYIHSSFLTPGNG